MQDRLFAGILCHTTIENAHWSHFLFLDVITAVHKCGSFINLVMTKSAKG